MILAVIAGTLTGILLETRAGQEAESC